MSQIASDGAPGQRASHGRGRPFTIRILAGAGLSLLVALVAARYSGSISNIDTQNIMARIRALRAILLGSSTPVVHAYCRPAGPMLPPPSFQRSPGDHHWTTIWVNDRSFPNDTSYAIKASIGDTEFVDLAYRSTGWIDGRRTPLSDTQFRIGSVTKLFTVLAILLSSDKISWEGPITRYVDGLSSAYEDVTIHALAGQTSGLGFMGWAGDVMGPPFDPTLLGLPVVRKHFTSCDILPGGKTCTRSEIIAMLNDPTQVPHSPNTSPQYSNIAYNLLGMALEQAYGKRYEDVVEDLILKPLELTTATFITPTNRTTAILPRPHDRWWVFDFASYNPTGGLWMTPNDLLKFMRSIQEHSLLSSAQTRAWLQPHALLPSLNQVVGAPWEILRRAVDTTYVIDIYTKSGDVQGYSALGALVPELNMTVTINVAGGSASKVARKLLHDMMDDLIQHATGYAKSQAYDKYEGTYTQPSSNSSLAVRPLDWGKGGLTIQSFQMNSVDVWETLAALHGYSMTTNGMPLYPTDLDSLGSEKETWRYILDDPDDESCQGWTQVDKMRHASEPLDVVKFVMKDGKAVAVELPAWRMTLEREKREE